MWHLVPSYAGVWGKGDLWSSPGNTRPCCQQDTLAHAGWIQKWSTAVSPSCELLRAISFQLRQQEPMSLEKVEPNASFIPEV